MSEVKRLTNRNELISAMLSDGEQLKNFYRFIAQNPHISLHDACQIIIERPNATICFSFNEWAAMDRRVTKGRKGIAYYDKDGYKQFVFDANDTHGDNRYSRPIIPMKCLLSGLDEMNGTEITDDERSDYRKIRKGVHLYLQERGELTGDTTKDKLLIDGIAYSLYAKTGFPKSSGIDISGLPYSYVENAAFVKDIYTRTELIVQDIEETYRESTEEVKVIDDTEEETVSDEPIISVEQTESTVEEHSVAPEPDHPMYPLYKRYMEVQETKPNAIVFIRIGDFYEMYGDSAIIASKTLDLILTGRNVGLPDRVAMCGVPYHAMDRYLDKMLESRGVVLIENDEEPKYVLSHAEALEQSVSMEKLQADSSTEIIANEPTAPIDEQSGDDDWRSELADELNDLDEELDEEIDELSEVEEDTSVSTERVKAQPKAKEKSTKKDEKGIKDRKRKSKAQPTLFDLVEPKEQSAEEALIDRQLKYGSGVEHGKFRIFDKYQENPSTN